MAPGPGVAAAQDEDDPAEDEDEPAEDDVTEDDPAEDDLAEDSAVDESVVEEPAVEEPAQDDPAEDGSGDDDPAEDGTDDDDLAGAPAAPFIVDDDGDDTTDGFIAGQAIVRLVPGGDIELLNARYGTVTLAAIASRDIYLLALPPGADEAQLVATLNGEEITVWAELNFVNQAPEGRPRNFFVSGLDAVPVDGPGGYASDLIGVPSGQACLAGGVGAGVVVAVLDTGVDPGHPALAGQLLAGVDAFGLGVTNDLGNGLDDDGDGLVDEMTGHGTHVAGIIAQVSPAASILPVRVLDSDGVGGAFFVAAGIFAATDAGADVINLSLGSTQDTFVVVDAIGESSGAGVVIAAAAGNSSREQPVEYPAAYVGALGIAATDANDSPSAFTNFGLPVDLAAPGTDIVSTYPGGLYAVWSGTSMATPWVTGAAALLLSVDPGLGLSGVLDRLAATAVPVTADGTLAAGALGAGRIDVGAAACG
jgi:subtilisin family serine protease